MAESGVKVLQVADVFRLFLCRKDRNCPSDIVWSDSLQGYPGNTFILLARSPCGRHRLRSPGPSIASFCSRKWLALCIRSVVGPCYLRMPFLVFLPAVDLRSSGLVEIAACGSL